MQLTLQLIKNNCYSTLLSIGLRITPTTRCESVAIVLEILFVEVTCTFAPGFGVVELTLRTFPHFVPVFEFCPQS